MKLVYCSVDAEMPWQRGYDYESKVHCWRDIPAQLMLNDSSSTQMKIWMRQIDENEANLLFMNERGLNIDPGQINLLMISWHDLLYTTPNIELDLLQHSLYTKATGQRLVS